MDHHCPWAFETATPLCCDLASHPTWTQHQYAASIHSFQPYFFSSSSLSPLTTSSCLSCTSVLSALLNKRDREILANAGYFVQSGKNSLPLLESPHYLIHFLHIPLSLTQLPFKCSYCRGSILPFHFQL